MVRMRTAFFGALFVVFFAGGAGAETHTAAIAPTIVKLSQKQLPLTIILGDIRGKLEATPLNGPYAEGASAFMQLTLSSESTAEKGKSAELILEAERGEIASIFGKDIKSENENGKRIVKIGGIGKNRSRRVLVELKLRSGQNASLNTLNFAIRSQGNQSEKIDGNSDPKKVITGHTISLSWPVASCERKYHAALKDIGKAGGSQLRKVWRNAQRPPKSYARRWHFRPSIPKRSQRNHNTENPGAISHKRERTILTKTAALMRSGFRRDLSYRGRYGWELSKTANDLKKYFTQDYNPAICTGALGFASYYEKKLSPLGERNTELSALQSDSLLLARSSIAAFIESMSNLPGGHPAWGGADLDTLKKTAAEGDDMKSLILRMLQAAHAKAFAVEKVSAAPNAYEAIRTLDRIGLADAGIRPRRKRSKLSQVLARTEAAIRLSAYRAQYEGFWLSFTKRLKDIRAAYAKHCVCES